MNAVIDIVSREGLSAATVRRIAQTLDCSPGQIHHHFASAEALRAEAVRVVWQRIEPRMLEALHEMPPRERLLAMLVGCKVKSLGTLEPVMDLAERLWHEAWDIRQDPAVRAALSEGMNKLHHEIICALEEGMAEGSFPADLDIRKAAMRLIAASQGFEMLEQIGVSAELGVEKLSFVEGILQKEGL